MNKEKRMILRRASMTDAELLFTWKNDKATIENSLSKRGVTMEEHLEWMKGIMDNPMRQLFILDVDGVSVGQLRLDIEKMPKREKVSELGKEEGSISKNSENIVAEISYGLGAEHRGKGLGKVLLEQAELLVEMFAITTLIAEVLPHNTASRKLFKKMGFEEEKKEEIYVYRKQYG